MEIRARYFLIGLFVLAVIGAGVGFIYWLYNNGGGVQRTAYAVSINGSVSGLSTGSPVLFNGIQVGEVTGLSLVAADPGKVIARIAVDARTPVRADTRVGMDFRGLTGTATISLTCGSIGAPPPPSIGGQPPLLVADAASIKDMTASAREALNRLNQIFEENAESLKSAIDNIATFSAALARNSDKVDSILSGLQKLTGGGPKVETVSYDLTAPAKFPPIDKLPDGQLSVAPPTTVVALDSQRIMLKNAGGVVPFFENYRWGDSIPLLVQARVLQGFENAGYPRVGSDTSGITGDFDLKLDVRAFGLDISGATPTARVTLMAKLVDGGGKVVDAKLFQGEAAVARTDDPQIAADGIDAAFCEAATDLIVWALAGISGAEDSGMPMPQAPAGAPKPAEKPAEKAPEPKQPAPAK
ncbi:ABC-type transport auxiliary lipoprotein family protein [soil metagenome]